MKKVSKDIKYQHRTGIFILVLIIIIVYSPGMSGGFLFDDFINLKNISVYDQFDGIEAILRYIFSYNSGVLKRPVSTLSFLLNAQSWPASPLFFKITNMLIHIVNSILFYIVAVKILSYYNNSNKRAKLIALVAVGIWSLHPYFVSTTFYIVQRMAMLPVMFTLLGFYFYLKAREPYVENLKKGRLYLFLSIYVCTGLAVLSKENGIMLPLYIYLFEVIIANKLSKIQYRKFDNWFFFFIPIIVVVLSFILSIPSFLDAYALREFTVYERLMTESRVLVLYLYHFFIPNYFTEGVYTDGIIVSKSLYNPLSTIFSITLILLIIIIAFFYKNKYTLLSFSIFFFFLANVIESTIIPLEFYFEHRAYMPLLFISLTLSYVVIIYIDNLNFKYKWSLLMVFIILPIMTFQRSVLWGDNARLIMLSAEKFPKSRRATESKASILAQNGESDKALILLKNSFNLNSKLSLMFNYFNLKCGTKKAQNEDAEILISSIKNQRIGKLDSSSLGTLFEVLLTEECIDNPMIYFSELLVIVKNKPEYNNKKIKQVIDYYTIIEELNNTKYQVAFTHANQYLSEFLAYNDTSYLIQLFIQSSEIIIANKLLDSLEGVLHKDKYTNKNYFDTIKVLRMQIMNKK